MRYNSNRFKSLPLADRLWLRIEVSGDPDACWEWTGGVTPDGYGLIGIGGRQRYVHIVAYELTHGSVPPRKVIRHTCNNRRCCNPSHLTPGTYKENTADSWAAGRQTSQRLTPEVRAYIASREGELSSAELGKELGFTGATIQTVWRVENRKQKRIAPAD